jgi:hypothetical protein
MASALADDSVPLADRLRAYLQGSAELMEELPLRKLLEQVLGVEGAAWAVGEMSGHLHVGFLAPAGTSLDLLGRLATEWGFGASQARFGSEILARELAWLLGRQAVPTTILKADAAERDGVVHSVEAFVPEVEPEVSRRWVEEGVGVHLALGLRHPESVERALQLCLDQGYRPPPFLEGRPALNVVNEIRVIYADPPAGGVRWEFFHSATEPALRAGGAD